MDLWFLSKSFYKAKKKEGTDWVYTSRSKSGESSKKELSLY